MTRMPCMRVHLRRAPRSATPHGQRPRVDRPNTPGAPPPARPCAPVVVYTLTDHQGHGAAVVPEVV